MEIRELFEDNNLTLIYRWQGISLKNFSIFLVVLLYVLGSIQYIRTYTRYYLEKKA